MAKKRKKRPVTLIEIMIVILLIGLIGGALAYNMRGSLDQGKAFKTEQNISRAYDILMMKCAEGESLDAIVEKPGDFLKNSPLVKDAEKLLVDGWGAPMTCTKDGDDIKITSEKLKTWNTQHGRPAS